MFGIAGLCLMNVVNADDRWTSELYNESWSAPGSEKNYETDKIIQDFSYAGYRKGEEDIPQRQDKSTFNVLHFGADPTGKKDSTRAIQKAIDAASVDGGIVFFPQGIYHVQPAPESTSALVIQASNVILRGEGIGKTRLLNTSTKMRQKNVISVQGTGSSWHKNEQTPVPISADLTGPTKRIPVESTAGFQEGDWVVLRADITKEWVLEHGVKKWLDVLNRLSGFSYFRQITRVDKENNALEIDIPIRYFLKKRDGARVYHKTKVLSGVGIEHLSLGNIENPAKAGWDSLDYQVEGTAAYNAHGSWLISFARVRDSWVQQVRTFRHEKNVNGSHLLSNGILLNETRGVTISHCSFQRPQYGGAGGNGYMYRLSSANENLIQYSEAAYSRHGFVFSHFSTSGNVIYRCIDRFTARQTGGTGNERTLGSGSDHHLHFSHSNLVDDSDVDNSYFVAKYRRSNIHALSSAHSVFWNIRGRGTQYTFSVHSDQARYGYVIGNSGEVHEVRTDVDASSGDITLPIDHVEGVGKGHLLEPQSLYLDQKRKRLGA